MMVGILYPEGGNWNLFFIFYIFFIDNNYDLFFSHCIKRMIFGNKIYPLNFNKSKFLISIFYRSL